MVMFMGRVFMFIGRSVFVCVCVSMGSVSLWEELYSWDVFLCL
jgi:hypothetical protein